MFLLIFLILHIKNSTNFNHEFINNLSNLINFLQLVLQSVEFSLLHLCIVQVHILLNNYFKSKLVSIKSWQTLCADLIVILFGFAVPNLIISCLLMDCGIISDFIYNVLDNAVTSYQLRLNKNPILSVHYQIISDLYKHTHLMQLSTDFKYTLPQKKVVQNLESDLADELWGIFMPWISTLTYWGIILVNLIEHWGFLNPNIDWNF